MEVKVGENLKVKFRIGHQSDIQPAIDFTPSRRANNYILAVGIQQFQQDALSLPADEKK